MTFTEDNGGTNTIPSAAWHSVSTAAATACWWPGSNAVSSGTGTTNAGTDTALGYQLTLDWADDLNTAGNNYQAVRTFTATTP